MRFEIRQAFFGFVDAGKMIYRHPPQGDIYSSHLFEPLVALPE